MRQTWWVALALVGAAACDDTEAVDGVRGPCGFGGDLGGACASERTPEGACSRLVSCGAIPLDAVDPNRFDWGRCVDAIEGMVTDRQGVVIDCIATATCDLLDVNGSPNNPYERIFCFHFGEN